MITGNAYLYHLRNEEERREQVRRRRDLEEENERWAAIHERALALNEHGQEKQHA